jgi:hypothetical protein
VTAFLFQKEDSVTKPNLEDLPSAPWGISAAYLYVLDLDDPALAWEYLRRNPGYRADWAGRKRVASFARWGLRCRRRYQAGRAQCATAVALVL